MKKIEAIIQPFNLEAVKEALVELGINGLTVTEVESAAHGRSQTRTFGGREHAADFLPRAKLETVLSDQQADQAVQVILKTAKFGEFGEGKIFVCPVAAVHRIRTGERNSDAVDLVRQSRNHAVETQVDAPRIFG